MISEHNRTTVTELPELEEKQPSHHGSWIRNNWGAVILSILLIGALTDSAPATILGSIIGGSFYYLLTYGIFRLVYRNHRYYPHSAGACLWLILLGFGMEGDPPSLIAIQTVVIGILPAFLAIRIKHHRWNRDIVLHGDIGEAASHADETITPFHDTQKGREVVVFNCPHCKRIQRIRAKLEGNREICSDCGGAYIVPILQSADTE